jgi:hypothetical protein
MMERVGMITCMIVVLILVTPSNIQASQLDNQNTLAATGINLVIDFGNGTVASFSGLTATTVYNLTVMLFEVDAQWTGDHVFINAIDGVYQDESHGWQYWVNENYASVAANLYNLHDGDSVLWNRTISGFHSTTEPDMTLIVGGVFLVTGGIVFLAILHRRTMRRK